MRWAIRWTLGAALLSAPLAGCESGDGAVIAEGRKALRANDYAAAHAKFDEALKADPESYDALWGKAEAFRGEAKLSDQQKVLEKHGIVRALEPRAAEANAASAAASESSDDSSKKSNGASRRAAARPS